MTIFISLSALRLRLPIGLWLLTLLAPLPLFAVMELSVGSAGSIDSVDTVGSVGSVCTVSSVGSVGSVGTVCWQ